ncbi:hypothetical protein EVG20_g5471 [Dentipellis fragilis]|uniref:Uncharacterized protein n=1 Tax=Dentipellis fragilis TaxID=205917 RepID=A0A4Y9YV67_9AGAM|nr:hypothetical protein EVG20_g5471 [Dentipellis fragilis]
MAVHDAHPHLYPSPDVPYLMHPHCSTSAIAANTMPHIFKHKREIDDRLRCVWLLINYDPVISTSRPRRTAESMLAAAAHMLLAIGERLLVMVLVDPPDVNDEDHMPSTRPIKTASCYMDFARSIFQHVWRAVLRCHDFSIMGDICLYTALFGGSIYVLLYRRPNKYHLGASIALFLLTTAFTGVTLSEVLTEPIITSSSNIVDGNTVVPCAAGSSEREHEALLGDLLEVVITVVVTCMNWIADGVLIYRCVVLYPERLGRWVGILLGVLLLAETATGFAQSYLATEEYHLVQQQTSADEGTLPPGWVAITITLTNLSTANTLLALVVNVLATALIASRIWLMAHQLEKTLGSKAGVRYRAAISIIVESGFLITASQLVMTCTNLVDTTLVYNNLISSISQMLVVISPTLIIVRVGLGRGFDSVVDTAHQHHAPQGARETQIRSIHFAGPRSITTDASHIASLGALVPGPELEMEGDADRGTEHLNAEKAGGTKAEVAPGVV